MSTLLRSRSSWILTGVVLFLIGVYTFHSRQPIIIGHQLQGSPPSSLQGGKPPRPQVALPVGKVVDDVAILKDLDLSPEIEFRRLCITPKETKDLARQSTSNISHTLFKPESRVTLGTKNLDPAQANILPPCSDTLSVDVPVIERGADADTSSLLLGVATTLPRIDDSLSALSRWLSNTGSRLVVVVVDHPDLEPVRIALDALVQKAAGLGIQLEIEPYINPKHSEGLKNFALAEALYKHRDEKTQWYGVIDDDTFFLSLPRMLRALSPYDPTKEWYIGALTERHLGIKREGFKAWGGAGFFLSPPLMKTLAENSPHCRTLDKGFGDLLWRDCILDVTAPTVQLTQLAGLNQIDMWGDIGGWYESGLNPLLTIHHWKSWHFHPVPNMHQVADVAGYESVLQRYTFDDNAVLTNGFSVVNYPQGLPDLRLVEATMVEDVGYTEKPERLAFHYSLGRTRPALPEGEQKISWRFARCTRTEGGGVRQFYVKRGNHDGKKGDKRSKDAFDSVIEIDWIV